MREIDRGRSPLSYGWLVAIIAVLVVAPAFGASATDAVSTDTPAPATEAAAEPSPLLATPASSPQASAGATSAFTWQLLSHEYCLDRFGTTCPNGATSADPCPYAAPAGKPCSVLFDRCWSVVSAYWADEYRCTY